MLTVAEAGRKGGKARLKKMTAEERQTIARQAAKALNAKLTPQQRCESARRAAQARWAKAKKKNHQN